MNATFDTTLDSRSDGRLDSSREQFDLSNSSKLIILIALVIGASIMVLPFVWMVSTACKTQGDLQKLPIQFIPANPVCFDNIQKIYERAPGFNRNFLNTIVLTLGRTFGQLITCSLAAYGFARYKFPGRNLIFALCLGLLMVPFQAILIPEFVLIRALDWRGTFAGLIIPGIFSAFAMFLLRQAFLNIPLELEEAAMLDGATPLGILYRIVLPLSTPALAAFAVITMQAAWNDFLYPLLIVGTDQSVRVLTVGIALLQGERNIPYNLIMMGSFMATVPMLILFVFLQRYFIQGVAGSGLNR